MRAREFTINIPINIKINGDGDPEVDMGNNDDDADDLDQDPIFVPPLQQQIELAKAGRGKNSKVIDKLTDDGPMEDDDQSQEVGAPQSIKNRFK